MSSIGVVEAKANLPKLLREVRKGRRFTIMEDREPVADLVPHLTTEPGPRLVAAGKPPSRKHVAAARKHVANLQRRRGKPTVDLEQFLEDARAEL